MSKKILVIGLLVALLGACAESQRPVATGKGGIHAINAAVGAPAVGFLLEERALGLPRFKNATPIELFDDLSYIANFDYLFLGELQTTRLASVPFDVDVGQDYLFVFTGSLAEPEVLLWERTIRIWDEGATLMQVTLAHLSPQLEEVDIYFAPPDVAPVLGEATATLTNGNFAAPIEVESGEFKLTVTAVGDPSDVLFESEGFTFVGSSSFLISLFDVDPSITAPISARIIGETNGISLEWGEVNSPPTSRLYHTANGVVPVDLYLDGDFSEPLIGNTAYAELSAETPSVSGTFTNTVTEADNVGNILLEEEQLTPAGSRSTRFLVGNDVELLTLLVVDNLRPRDDGARFRLVQTSLNVPNQDIYILDTGEPLEEATPRFSGAFTPVNTDYISLLPGTYDIYITAAASETVAAGPVTFTVDDGDVVHYVVIDTDDPTVVDVIEYERAGSMP